MARITEIEDVDLINYGQLSTAEVEDFDPDHYADDTFFRYRSRVYAMGNFTRIPDATSAERQAGFHGGFTETVFSAVLVGDVDHQEDTVRVGYWSE